MEIKGTVKAVLQPKSGIGPRGPWKSQTVVVEYQSGDYPTNLALTNMRNPDSFGQLKLGKVYTFKINPRSRERNNNWYTECICYAWEEGEAEQQQQSYDGYQL